MFVYWFLWKFAPYTFFFSIRDVAKFPVLLSPKSCHFFSTSVPYSSLIFSLSLYTVVSYKHQILMVSYKFGNSKPFLSTNFTFFGGSSTRPTTLLTKIQIFRIIFWSFVSIWCLLNILSFVVPSLVFSKNSSTVSY